MTWSDLIAFSVNPKRNSLNNMKSVFVVGIMLFTSVTAFTVILFRHVISLTNLLNSNRTSVSPLYFHLWIQFSEY